VVVEVADFVVDVAELVVDVVGAFVVDVVVAAFVVDVVEVADFVVDVADFVVDEVAVEPPAEEAGGVLV